MSKGRRTLRWAKMYHSQQGKQFLCEQYILYIFFIKCCLWNTPRNTVYAYVKKCWKTMQKERTSVGYCSTIVQNFYWNFFICLVSVSLFLFLHSDEWPYSLQLSLRQKAFVTIFTSYTYSIREWTACDSIWRKVENVVWVMSTRFIHHEFYIVSVSGLPGIVLMCVTFLTEGSTIRSFVCEDLRCSARNPLQYS